VPRPPALSWTAASDEASSISGYQIKFGTTKGGDDVLPLQAVALSDTAGGSITFTQSNLSLQNNIAYFPTIVAIDGAGNRSSELQGDAFSIGWQQQAALRLNLTYPDGVSNDMALRNAMSGNTLVIGLAGEDSASPDTTTPSGIYPGPNLPTPSSTKVTDSGAVFVYTLINGKWVPQAYIKSPVGAALGWLFGGMVAIDGDYMAISWRNTGTSVGVVRTYQRNSAGVWTLDAKILGSVNAAGANNGTTADGYGGAIAMHGSRMVIGSNRKGGAWVYNRGADGVWTFEAKLASSYYSTSGDVFGTSVGIYDDTVVIGAHKDGAAGTAVVNNPTGTIASDAGFAESGAVHVFKKVGASWTQTAYLKAPNSATLAHFGEIVKIDKDTIAVSARDESNSARSIVNAPAAFPTTTSGTSKSGAVYVFTRSDSAGWQAQAYLKAPNAAVGAIFGTGLALRGDTILVASIDNSPGTTPINGESAVKALTVPTVVATDPSYQTGAGYVFKRSGSEWRYEAFIKTRMDQGGALTYGCSLASENLGVIGFKGDITGTEDGKDVNFKNGALVIQR
jgi:hypothetical protein